MKNVNYNKSRIGIIEILKRMRAKIKITNIKNQTNRLEELFVRLTSKND